jgi:hypothetical protein
MSSNGSTNGSGTSSTGSSHPTEQGNASEKGSKEQMRRRGKKKVHRGKKDLDTRFRGTVVESIAEGHESPEEGPLDFPLERWAVKHRKTYEDMEEERRRQEKISDHREMKIVLESAGANDFLGNLQDNGIWGLEGLKVLKEEDLKELGMKLGQRRRLQVAIRDRKEKLKREKEREKLVRGNIGLFGGNGKKTTIPTKYRPLREPHTNFVKSLISLAKYRISIKSVPHPNASYFLHGANCPDTLIEAETEKSDYLKYHAKLLLNPPASKIQTWWR